MENEYLLDYVGKTQNNKTQDELRKLTLELNKRKGLALPMSIIQVIPPGDDEIKSIGMSTPDDLVLNNFGFWLTGIIGRASPQSLFVDTGGVTRFRNFSGSSVVLDQFNITQRAFGPTLNMTCGTGFQLGEGITPAARTDFKIETLLGAAPENALQTTSEGTFSSGPGTVSASKSFPNANGSGDITEFGMFMSMGGFQLNPTSITVMITHDIISPAVSYSVGEIILVELVWNL